MDIIGKLDRSKVIVALVAVALALAAAQPQYVRGDEAAAPAVASQKTMLASQTLVYPTLSDGSIMNWLAVSPLKYDAAYIGDSLSYDVFKNAGLSELTVAPRAGDQVQGVPWKKETFGGTTEGPTMCQLFQIAGYSWDYGITVCCCYVYSPTDHPAASFYGSSDDGLKVILNGKLVWKNQIQRSPTYDSDQFAAPLNKGWNRLVCVVDQVIGGHLLCGRFVDGGQPVTDLQISLDPAAPDASRFPAADYNASAETLIQQADALSAVGKLTDAAAAYGAVMDKYPLAEVTPRAAYGRALIYYDPSGAKSLDQPQQAVSYLQQLIADYPADLRAEYADMDLAAIQDLVLKDRTSAESTYRSFESKFPGSELAPKSVSELARLLALDKNYDESILTYRKVIGKYPNSDEVMVATIGIADDYVAEGETVKAKAQYVSAQAMATDWIDNKYGVDVGKQAWLRGLEYDIRVKSQALPAKLN